MLGYFEICGRIDASAQLHQVAFLDEPSEVLWVETSIPDVADSDDTHFIHEFHDLLLGWRQFTHV